MPFVNAVACLKFEANIFDRSRCQNCFKAFHLHRKDHGRDDNQLGNQNLHLCASAVNQEDLQIITPDCNLYCCSSPEELIASWKMEPRIHNHLTSQFTRKWALDTVPFQASELSNAVITRGHSLRGERMLGSSTSALQGEGRNWDMNSDSPVWSQLNNRMHFRGRSDSVETRGKTMASMGGKLVSGERVSSRNSRMESGYFSLERTKQDTVPSPRRTVETKGVSQSNSAALGNTAGGGGVLSLGCLTSSQSSFESETSWGTGSVASSDGRLLRQDYTVLADIPMPKRIISREKLEQDCKQLGQRIRTRSPGREEVERLFGQERRPVTDTYREFSSANVGKVGRKLATSQQFTEESRKRNIYPRKFQQQETDRGLNKQISSKTLENKEKSRYLSHQYDKMDTKFYSQKDESKLFTKCSRVASETNKANGRFGRGESKANVRYLQSSPQNGKKMFQSTLQGHSHTKINPKPKKILEELTESLVEEMDGKFSSKEESKTYKGYLRSSPKIDKLDYRFSSQDQSSRTGYVQLSPKRDKVDIIFSPLEEQNSYNGYVSAFSRTDRIDRCFLSRKSTNSLNRDIYLQNSDNYDKTSTGFSNRTSSNSLNRDVYLQTSDKHNMTDRGFSSRMSLNSRNRDIYTEASDNYDKTNRGFSNRTFSNSLSRDVQRSDNYEKIGRGFSNRTSSNSQNRDIHRQSSNKPVKMLPKVLSFSSNFCFCY